MRRPHLLALITVGVVLFLAISALLARVFSVDGAERAAITSLVGAEARGDQAGMLRAIKDCAAAPACRLRVAQDTAALTRPGEVTILQILTSAGFSLGGTEGNARVAWKTSSSLPIVQCVRVRRAGNALSGVRVELLAISRRIGGDQECPRRF